MGYVIGLIILIIIFDRIVESWNKPSDKDTRLKDEWWEE